LRILIGAVAATRGDCDRTVVATETTDRCGAGAKVHYQRLAHGHALHRAQAVVGVLDDHLVNSSAEAAKQGASLISRPIVLRVLIGAVAANGGDRDRTVITANAP